MVKVIVTAGRFDMWVESLTEVIYLSSMYDRVIFYPRTWLLSLTLPRTNALLIYTIRIDNNLNVDPSPMPIAYGFDAFGLGTRIWGLGFHSLIMLRLER